MAEAAGKVPCGLRGNQLGGAGPVSGGICPGTGGLYGMGAVAQMKKDIKNPRGPGETAGRSAERPTMRTNVLYHRTSRSARGRVDER